MRFRRLAPALCVAILALSPALASAQESGLILFGAGRFNVSGAQDPAQLDLEWRSAPKALALQINAGTMINGDAGLFAFGGLRRDFHWGQRFGISPGFGVGLWKAGSGLDLGGPLQFRTSLELFAEIGKRSRLGFMAYHLSNGGLHHEPPGSEVEANPGSNSIVVVYGRRLR